MPKQTEYSNLYASIELQSNGRWAVFNDVTGLLVEADVPFPYALDQMRDIATYYKALEHGR